MSEDRTRKTLEGVGAFLRNADPERFMRAMEAVAHAETVEAPPSASMPGGSPFLGGGRWLRMRMNGPDFSALSAERARARVAPIEPVAPVAPVAPVEAEEPVEDKRFALLEVGERDP